MAPYLVLFCQTQDNLQFSNPRGLAYGQEKISPIFLLEKESGLFVCEEEI